MTVITQQQSTFRFYEAKVYTCPICGSALRWMRRADRDDSMVLIHESVRPLTLNPCRLAGRTFYPPMAEMPEIKGTINGMGQFVPEWETPSREQRSGGEGQRRSGH